MRNVKKQSLTYDYLGVTAFCIWQTDKYIVNYFYLKNHVLGRQIGYVNMKNVSKDLVYNKLVKTFPEALL